MLHLVATLAGVLVMLSLSMAPGPRNGLLVAASLNNTRQGRHVLFGYALADTAFAGLALLAVAALLQWRFLVPVAAMASIGLFLFLTIVDIRSLRYGEFDPRRNSAVPGSFQHAFAASLANPGLAFDAVIPVAAMAALFGDGMLAGSFVVGSLLGSIGWMAALHIAARRPESARLLAQSWSRLVRSRILLSTAAMLFLGVYLASGNSEVLI